MTWSTGEISTLTMRAVRGAGHPWGVAEEAAWAVRWLVRAGLPGPDALVAALDAGDLGDLLAGIALADRGAAPAELQPAAAVLMLPFIARTAPAGRAHVFSDGGSAFRIWAGGCDVSLPDRRLSLDGAVAVPGHRRLERADLTAGAHLVLTTLAGRTYAPATEDSRIRGAGAGLTDND